MVANQDLDWAGYHRAGYPSRNPYTGNAGIVSSSEHRPASIATSPMQHSSVPHVLKYNITSVAGGVLLRIWEPAPKDEVRVKPFLFMLKYRMTSEAEARKFLEDYLKLYKTALLQTHGHKKTGL